MMSDHGGQPLQSELAAYIEKYTGEDGTHATRIPELQFIRVSTESEPIHAIHEPALCIVAQGTKLITLAEESYLYDPSSYLVVSLNLPPGGCGNSGTALPVPAAGF